MRSGWGNGGRPKSVSSHLPLAKPCSANSCGSQPPVFDPRLKIDFDFKFGSWLCCRMPSWSFVFHADLDMHSHHYCLLHLMFLCCLNVEALTGFKVARSQISSHPSRISLALATLSYFLPNRSLYQPPLFLPWFPQRMLSS